ncbi:hypothetical protein PT274_03430 [Leuconostocaceae bacterium ESL0958]|nr:hypothetical protein [Leuconostocaceae bacterium ESL0958]
MNIDRETFSNLTASMNEYNSTANHWVEAIAHSVQAIALIILGVTFLMQVSKTSNQFRETQGSPLNTDVVAQIAVGYLVSLLMIMLSVQIVDAIIWVGNLIAKVVATTGGLSNGHAPDPANMNSAIFDSSKVNLHWYQKPLFFVIYSIHQIIWSAVKVIATILIFLRFLSLCIFKATAPVMVSFWMIDDFRPVAINYLKQIMAIALQSVVLIVVLKLYPLFLSSDSLTGNHIAFGTWVSVAGVALIKSIAVIIAIIGTQNLARRMVGV